MVAFYAAVEILCIHSENLHLRVAMVVHSGENPKAWLLSSFGDDRQYAGNTGYMDEPRRLYRYDNFVQNNKQIKEGDIVFIRDREILLGVAQIKQLSSKPGYKDRIRCPLCGTTSLEERKSARPMFRCRRGHQFDEPRVERVSCIQYEAYYGDTFIDTPGAIPIEVLRAACLRRPGQLAMQEISVESLLEPLIRAFPEATIVLGGNPGPLLEAGEEFLPPEVDSRTVAQRLIRWRQGQGAFKDSLLSRYGASCMVTGCKISEIVEAAHIDPYKGRDSNHPENGILLRADVHTLFDLDLLAVEPEDLIIRIHPEFRRDGYEHFEGSRLMIRGSRRPSRTALKIRWLLFERRLRGRSTKVDSIRS